MEGVTFRRIVDFLALVPHGVLLGYALNSEYTLQTDPVHILSAMSIITIVFHVIYVYGSFWDSRSILGFKIGSEERNTLKWIEYSVTATLGTIAVALSGENAPPPEIVFFIAAVAVTEQMTGLTWDSIDTFPGRGYSAVSGASGEIAAARRAFWTTAICQAGEFVVLSLYKDPNSAEYVFYVIGWSLFGLYALLREPIFDQIGLDIPGYEAGYSILSTFAKTSVFASVIHASRVAA